MARRPSRTVARAARPEHSTPRILSGAGCFAPLSRRRQQRPSPHPPGRQAVPGLLEPGSGASCGQGALKVVWKSD